MNFPDIFFLHQAIRETLRPDNIFGRGSRVDLKQGDTPCGVPVEEGEVGFAGSWAARFIDSNRQGVWWLTFAE